MTRPGGAFTYPASIHADGLHTACDDSAGEFRAGRDHARSVSERDSGLLLGDRRGVDFSAFLGIGQHEVEPNASGKRCLATAFPDFEIGHAEAAKSVRSLPTEEAAHNE